MSEQMDVGNNILPAKGSNSLATKITAVLSTSFSDTEFREALTLIDQQGFANDARNRRQIRINLQKEVIDSNGTIIDNFGRVSEAEYEGIKTQVALAQSETSPTLREAASLLEKREEVFTKQRVLSAFKEYFLLTEPELVALTSTAEPVDERFFDALSKARKISKDCEILLGLQEQTLGLDLMEQTSKHLNFGFQKLYKWTQRGFKTLDLENPHMNTSIRQALRVLAERPSLFQNCLNFFAEARERILSEAFHTALTGTTSSGIDDASVKPIDAAAHDMLRYVGDMLAWVHSATVSEREALEILFISEGEELAKGLREGRDAEVWRLVADDEGKDSEFNALAALNDLVDRDVAGVTRLVRQRVEQVVQANEEILPAYKLATLLGFYGLTFEKLLGSASFLSECIHSLEMQAFRQFRSLLKDNIAIMQTNSENIPVDLAPPLFFSRALDQLDAIMHTYDSSLSSTDFRGNEVESVLADALEPFISACDIMAKSMKPLKAAIFTVNFNLAAYKCLAKFDFAKERAEDIRINIREASTRIVQSQYEFFRGQSGLESLFNNINDSQDAGGSCLDRDILTKASQQLDEFLPSALMDAIDRVKCVQDTILAHQMTEEAADLFCKDFEKLELEIDKKDSNIAVNDAGSLRSRFPRTSAEIRVLLS
ncbi:Golgi transport complex subunit Cog6, putative [Metarhizium acridum CQMa 102]|uniref:Conserved oligomeric Golgi complex subunit 6 n=1 Tax=Metarhizium acridum (strain CQMa 102) TaxID=655827 RepID=E9DS45_METAQ|nr:Golgi transport complex subunit Cog6, putative [Metarhizium acridum CQMa 102]EFY93627.1 Golgi transport complex subunit Cog6, putative [Metarhizium acridum CQMa 102]